MFRLLTPVVAAVVIPVRLRVAGFESAAEVTAIQILVAVLATEAVVRVAPLAVRLRLVATVAAAIAFALPHAFTETVVVGTPLDLPVVTTVVRRAVAIRV